MANQAVVNQNFDIVQVITAASQLRLVHINRDDFLREAFQGPKYAGKIEDIITNGPIKAGLSKSAIGKAADNSIKLETTKVTALSAAAGIPGGLAMIGTVPADLAQFYAHVLRVIQKLMYLYGWEDIGTMDECIKSEMILFIGAMSGVQAAEQAIAQLCKDAMPKVAKQIAAKALMKGALYPIVKKVCTQLGIKMTKDIFAKAVAKAIPLIGAVFSGALTISTFLPMSRRLKKILDDNSF